MACENVSHDQTFHQKRDAIMPRTRRSAIDIDTVIVIDMHPLRRLDHPHCTQTPVDVELKKTRPATLSARQGGQKLFPQVPPTRGDGLCIAAISRAILPAEEKPRWTIVEREKKKKRIDK